MNKIIQFIKILKGDIIMKKMFVLLIAFLSTSILFNSCTMFKSSELVVEMVLIPAGTFQMGNTGNYKREYTKHEEPVHNVTISKDFYMGKYEITQAQYRKVMNERPSYFTGDNLPVEQVSWFDAVEFCNKLSEMEGLDRCYKGNGDNIVCDWKANGYRLPTEAEWEYAAKAGTTTDFYSGELSERGRKRDRNLNRIGWYNYNSESCSNHVGEKDANAFGLYDMSGNVWEWCWDRYHRDYYANSPTRDPKGPFSGSMRVFRGGSWNNFSENARSSTRGFSNSLNGDNDYGFRIVRTK
jgi:sulfatase modifying factor 1